MVVVVHESIFLPVLWFPRHKGVCPMGMVKHVLYLVEAVCERNGVSDILDHNENHETITIEKGKFIDICFEMFTEGRNHENRVNTVFAENSPISVSE
jgi:hypothetical protein